VSAVITAENWRADVSDYLRDLPSLMPERTVVRVSSMTDPLRVGINIPFWMPKSGGEKICRTAVILLLHGKVVDRLIGEPSGTGVSCD
jgi:hypothetical protein